MAFATNQPANAMTRIESDIETMKQMSAKIDGITDCIFRHSRALGYLQPTPPEKDIAPSQVITTLADALSALDRSIDRCSGSLNSF